MLRNAAPYIFAAIAILLIVQVYRSNFSFQETRAPVAEIGRPEVPQESSLPKTPETHDEYEDGKFQESETTHSGHDSLSSAGDPQLFTAIDELISQAETNFENLLSRQSPSLEEAARAYRKRRGRHPPPGFDAWFEYAQKHDAVIVEDFWDQIYHDLEPFWAVSPAMIRAQARKGEMAVFVQDGEAFTKTDWFWHVIWKKMIHEVAHMLPDMMVPLNPMDEPRMLVPFADINAAIATAIEEKSMPHPADVKQSTQGWQEDGEVPIEIPKVEWLQHVSPYSWVRAACDPQSPLHTDLDFLHNGKGQKDHLQALVVPDARKLFVKNTTFASDTCSDPEIAAYHAAVLTPLTTKSSQTLQPMFGGSKLSVNNEILLPAPMYWNGEERFEQPDYHRWSEKMNKVVWRGTATGGRHNAFNWHHFHRHRFVALANGTKLAVSNALYDKILPPSERQSAVDVLPAELQRNLAHYLSQTNNVGFTDLFCDVPAPEGTCWYLDDEYTVSDMFGLGEQYRNKIVPDIDGNSFSGRYRSFLFSASLPFKATLFREWHDSRLMAWKHFVPMSNRFTEYYSLLAYFLGCTEEVCGPSGAFPGHEAEAEAIATAGSEWAKKVLRKEDMHIYVGRLLLEYGRITDDNRLKTGWVGDLLPDDTAPDSLPNDTAHDVQDHDADSDREFADTSR